jgi:peptidoglycan/LPS O-acetylase OafA/YrhL
VRVSELDSVRGLAALVVVLHHLWQTVLPDQNTFPLAGYAAAAGPLMTAAFWISVSPARLLFCGHAAVGLFFVLSGFALTKALQSPRQRDYRVFLLRRFFRIYPPFALTILLAAALSWMIHPQAIPGRDWIDAYWTTPVTGSLVLGHLAMIESSGYYNSLNSAMWTLVHELRISLVFPLIAVLAFTRPWRVLAASVAVFALLSITHLTSAAGALIHTDLLREIAMSVIQTLRYVMFFVLGILMATQTEAIGALLRRYRRFRIHLWVAAAVLLAVPYTKGYTEICYAAGAFILLNLSLHSDRARAALRHPALQWLGKVSYSLYLVHLVVLLGTVYLLHDVLPMGVILLLALPGSLLAAELFNRAVELPSSEIGKWLAQQLPRGRATSGAMVVPGARTEP